MRAENAQPTKSTGDYPPLVSTITPQAPTEPPPWHALPLEAVANRLDTTLGGLDDHEARERLARLGPNRLPPPKATSRWLILLRQFKSPLIYVLLAAAAIALALGELSDAGFIAAVLLLNAAIGF
ncbi:MAG: cation-transporting P-type ATPase, partial [Planctomycetota bacterium]